MRIYLDIFWNNGGEAVIMSVNSVILVEMGKSLLRLISKKKSWIWWGSQVYGYWIDDFSGSGEASAII